MHEWIQNQDWSEELWVAAWVAVVVVVSIVALAYETYLHRR